MYVTKKCGKFKISKVLQYGAQKPPLYLINFLKLIKCHLKHVRATNVDPRWYDGKKLRRNSFIIRESPMHILRDRITLIGKPKE